MEHLSRYIDHTVLKADTQLEDIKKLAEEAKQYNFFAVCVNGCYVSEIKHLLEGTDVKIAAVVGFPLGAATMESKVFETEDAINNGASEIDMVINIGALKDRRYDYVREEIEKIVQASENKAIVKVIIETALLTEEEKEVASRLSKEAKAHFVKTSTGFSTGGATKEDVALMKRVVGDKLEVKASGGVRDYAKAKEMIDAGATRIGASASVKIVKENETAK